MEGATVEINDIPCYAELAVRLVSIEEAVRLKKATLLTAKNALSDARKRLEARGWRFLKETQGERVQIVGVLPPRGMTLEEGLAGLAARRERSSQHRQEQPLRPEQEAAWRATAQQTGREVLSWREMGILGWSPKRAFAHRATASYHTAELALGKARKKLREEGWTVPAVGVATPPPGTQPTPRYLRERADAQQKSNWLLRLPESA